MIEFRPVRLEDRAAIERFTLPSDIRNCDLAFAIRPVSLRQMQGKSLGRGRSVWRRH